MANSFNRRATSESALLVGFRIVLVTLPLLTVLHVDRAGAVTPHSLRPHVCRVINQLEGNSDLGSGTLIHKTTDGREGLVLTCAHLFREGVGNIIVRFADGHAHRATLIDVDAEADLAALAIAHPVGIPVAVSSELSTDANLYACGYTISELAQDATSFSILGHEKITLDKATTILDTLQTDSSWSVDNVGYNFRHEVDVSQYEAFPQAGSIYQVRYEITPTVGQKIVFRFRVRCI